MAHSSSAKKRMRQSEARRVRNRARKSALKTQVRKFTDAIHDQNAVRAGDELRKTIKAIDQQAAKRVMHRNAAARKKSRLTRQLNKLAAQAAPAR